jgi:hypothetical protein
LLDNIKTRPRTKITTPAITRNFPVSIQFTIALLVS